MATGLGLRVIPNDSVEEIGRAKPIPNEIMVTSDEARVHASQNGIEGANAPLRALPFMDEVVMLGQGSAQGLTEHSESTILSNYKGCAVVSADGSKAIASDGLGGVSLIDTSTGEALGNLSPSTPVQGFGVAISASSDLGVVAISGTDKTVIVLSNSSGSYSEIFRYVDPNVQISSVSVSGLGSTLAVGLENKGSNKGLVFIYRIDGVSVTQYQSITKTDGATGDLYGCSVSLSDDGLELAVGAAGDSEGRGGVFILSDARGSFTQKQKLSVPAGLIGDRAGTSVALSGSGSVLAFGASGRVLLTPPIQFNSGAVFVAKKLESGLFDIKQELQSDVSGSEGFLGSDISLSGNGKVVMAGADRSLYFGNSAGAVVAFIESDKGFVEASSLSLSGDNTGGFFGKSVSIDAKGARAAIGSAKGLMLSLSTSSWQKSIPELFEFDITEGTDKQGSISGRLIKLAVAAEIDAIPELSAEGIKERSTVGAKISGKTLSDELSRVEAVAAGVPPSEHAIGITSIHPLHSGSAASIDPNENIATAIESNSEFFVDEDLFGSWAVELSFVGTGTGHPAELNIQIGSENIGLFFRNLSVQSFSEDSRGGRSYNNIWEDYDRTEADPIIVGLQWESMSSVKLLVERKGGVYGEVVIPLKAPAESQKATVSISFEILEV